MSHTHALPSMPTPTATATGEPMNCEEALHLLASRMDACEPCQRRYTERLLVGPPEVVAAMSIAAFRSLKFIIDVVASTSTLPGGAISDAQVLAEPTRRVYRRLEQDAPTGEVECLVREFTRDERAAVLDDAMDELTEAALSIQR